MLVARSRSGMLANMKSEPNPLEALRTLSRTEAIRAGKRILWAIAIGALLIVVFHGLEGPGAGDQSRDRRFTLMMSVVVGLMLALPPIFGSLAARYFSQPGVFT